VLSSQEFKTIFHLKVKIQEKRNKKSYKEGWGGRILLQVPSKEGVAKG